LTRGHLNFFKKITKFKKFKKIKKSEKPRSDTWQSPCMVVNDLNGVSKKGPD